MLAAANSEAAVVAFDGGITLWISYDNLDTTGASLADTITEANVLTDAAGDPLDGAYSCTATNIGRSDVGAPDSPPSCPGGTGSCTGQEKISGDIEKLADYIFQSTEGTHYLRRVYISDQGRAWDSADIKWNVGVGGSASSGIAAAWANSDFSFRMSSAYRTCIHDVTHHELGHYLYSLPDRYDRSDGYFKGTMPGDTTVFNVDVTGRDVNTVMSYNFPHVFVDTTNAQITVDYDQPGPGSTTGEVLTPGLLSDGDSSNDGPNRAHHYHTSPFAQDEWSLLPGGHVDLTGVHTEGTFADPGARPAVDIVIIGDDEPHPGAVLLLDRSGSMGVTTHGVTAAQFVQEAGMFLYHSSEPDDLVGTYLYNESVEELFPYATYDPTNDLSFVNFRSASGLTDIAEALETAIDALIAEHGEGGVSGAEIYLMSDGKQTTGASLWDQVTRANERGIKIHTLSFGNADIATMDGIASGTSGSNTPLSEREDAAELKMVMTRKFATGRGLTPVFSYKGRMDDVLTTGKNQIHLGEFSVPPKSRDLKFYVFLHEGDASRELKVQLKDPDGATFESLPPDNIVKKGRFNGVKVSGPKAGKWAFLISSIEGSLPDEDIEIAAYADNRELKGKIWFEDPGPDGAVPVRARLFFRYPLTDITVSATLYAAGDPVAVIPMFDDGSNGGDVQAGDGVYSAIVGADADERKRLLSLAGDRTDKIRVEAEFGVSEASRPAMFAHYETGFTPEMAEADYARGNRAEFKAWSTGILDLADLDPTRQPRKPQFGDMPLKDPVRTEPGGKGTFNFSIENAYPLVTQMRVSLGQGIDVEVKPADAGKGERAEFVVQFTTSKEAAPGPRMLRVQFGNVLLEWPKFAYVEAAKDTPAVEDGKADDFRALLEQYCWYIILVLIAVILILLILLAARRRR